MSMSILLYVFSVTKYEFFVLAFSGVTICVDRVVFKLISTYLIPTKSKWICGNHRNLEVDGREKKLVLSPVKSRS
jgi:hypothetical protein